MTLPGVAWGDTIADGRFFVSCRLSWPVARRFPGTWFAASGTTVVLGSGREWKGGGQDARSWMWKSQCQIWCEPGSRRCLDQSLVFMWVRNLVHCMSRDDAFVTAVPI